MLPERGQGPEWLAGSNATTRTCSATVGSRDWHRRHRPVILVAGSGSAPAPAVMAGGTAAAGIPAVAGDDDGSRSDYEYLGLRHHGRLL